MHYHTIRETAADTSTIHLDEKKGLLYYSSNTNEFEKVLSFLCKGDFFLLWIKPKKCYFEQREISVLLEAVNTLKCVLWFISSGSEFSSRKINDLKRAFGGWRSLSSSVFRKRDHFLRQKKYYSDLSILTSSAVAEGEKFFSRGLFGYDSTVAFTQSSDSVSSEFDSLANIWLTRLQENPITPLHDKQLNIVEYLNEVIKKKGIAGLVVEDVDSCKSLILLSEEETPLKQAFTKLQSSNYFQVASDSEMASFVIRGLGLTLLS